MATSTQKLIIIMMAINMLIGITTELYNNTEDGNTAGRTQMQEQITTADGLDTEMKSDEGLYGTIKSVASRAYEATIGNTLKWGKKIIDTLGLNPISIRPSMFEDELSKNVAYIILWIRSLITTIAGVEVFLIIKNRKT